MKKLLYVLTGLCLLAGLFAGCEKPEKESEKAKSAIKGYAVDKETGNLLSGVTIEIQPTGKQVQTTEDGAYIFENLKAGVYTLKAQKDGYDDYENAEIQLGVEQTLTLDIELAESTPCALAGKVTDKKTGAPLFGVTLELQPGNKQVQTAEDGTYRFDSLKVRKYTLKAQKDGCADYIKEGIQPIVDQTITLNIEMEDEYKAEYDYTITRLGLNMDMVYVLGGEFEMGATAEQDGFAWDDENPVRTIRLDGYHIGKYEVTQAQWKAVMETDPSEFKGDNLPVEKVSWEEAREFCKKLSEATGKQYVLPTEAQWEYAARGGKRSQHYIYAGSNDITDVAWSGNGAGTSGMTHPVGTKKANELGIHDMSGNVWEWCSDWYVDSYDVNDTENPQGPTIGSHRVHRGGDWKNIARKCRVSVRGSAVPINRYVGFRVACSAE